jgi:integrase
MADFVWANWWALRCDDILRRDREAFLRVQGKGDKHRLVPVAPALVRRLDRYIRPVGPTRGTPSASS